MENLSGYKGDIVLQVLEKEVLLVQVQQDVKVGDLDVIFGGLQSTSVIILYSVYIWC